MKLQAYHIKVEKSGCVFITPIMRGAKGRPVRNTHARRKFPDVTEALEGVRVMVGAAKVYRE